MILVDAAMMLYNDVRPRALPVSIGSSLRPGWERLRPRRVLAGS